MNTAGFALGELVVTAGVAGRIIGVTEFLHADQSYLVESIRDGRITRKWVTGDKLERI
jgi:hypothetical protein